MAATGVPSDLELHQHEFKFGVSLREFVHSSSSAQEAQHDTVVTAVLKSAASLRESYSAATSCGIDFDDASMSGTVRWPNSHVFQWLPQPSEGFCRLFASWEIAGWKQYLSMRQLGSVFGSTKWTLSKAGHFPASLGLESCTPIEVRTLLSRFGPSKAALAKSKASSSAGATDSRTAAAAAAQVQTLATPSGPVQYHVSLLDGLSLPLTIAHAVRSIGWRAVCTPSGTGTFTPAAPNSTIILAGASRRAEQRIAACTPYLQELALAMGSVQAGSKQIPVAHISVLLVGPEVAPPHEGTPQWIAVPSYSPAAGASAAAPAAPQLRYACMQDTLHGFMGKHWSWGPSSGEASGLLAGAHAGNTLIVTVNPGYGNLFASLTKAWLPSLHAALRSRCVLLGLCANHDADALGEQALLQRGFPGSLQQLSPPGASPFASMSTWVGDGDDAQAGATEKRAKQLAQALHSELVGDSNAYAGQSYWYAVRGKQDLTVAPELAAAAAFSTRTANK